MSMYKGFPRRRNYNPFLLQTTATNQRKVNSTTIFENQQRIVKPLVTEDDIYYDSYSHFEIHEEMLHDYVRTSTYKNAMLYNKPLFKGKVVLDIGCGTGILSMFAATAGAKQVIGIDASDIADFAKIIVTENRLDDVITIVKGKVEEIDQLPHGITKVDIIVSEWMGYGLFYECMLDTVLTARDKWLTPEGSIWPDKFSLYITGIGDMHYKEETFDSMKNRYICYGLDMSVMGDLLMRRARVGLIDPASVVTDTCLLVDIDLLTLKKGEKISFKKSFHLTGLGDDYLNGFVIFFTAEFSSAYAPTWFSTSPHAPSTHWKQTAFHLDDYAVIRQGEEVRGEFTLNPDPGFNRQLIATIKTDYDGELSSLHAEHIYHLF